MVEPPIDAARTPMNLVGRLDLRQKNPTSQRVIVAGSRIQSVGASEHGPHRCPLFAKSRSSPGNPFFAFSRPRPPTDVRPSCSMINACGQDRPVSLVAASASRPTILGIRHPKESTLGRGSGPRRPTRFERALMPRRSQLAAVRVQRILGGIRYRTLRANVECARSELRWHRLQLRGSHYRFLRVGETLRPSRFHRRSVEFVVL